MEDLEEVSLDKVILDNIDQDVALHHITQHFSRARCLLHV